MIAIPSHAKIFVCIPPVDFRNGINGLGRLCRQQLKKDPMSGGIFVFRNRKKTTLKMLVYDGEAFWLMTRRLSRGKLTWWPVSDRSPCELKVKQLQTLIMNGNPDGAEFSDDWKKVLR